MYPTPSTHVLPSTSRPADASHSVPSRLGAIGDQPAHPSVVEQARGIVMAHFGMSPGSAITLLQESSSRTGMSLGDLSSILVQAVGRNEVGSRRDLREGPMLDTVLDWLLAGAVAQRPQPYVCSAAAHVADPTEASTEPPAELLDAMADLIVGADGPPGRAAVIAALVLEMQALVQWCRPGLADEEFVGLDAVVAVAQTHLVAMRSLQVAR